MRVFIILFLLLALFCPATAAQTANPASSDTLSRHFQQQIDSIKLDLQKAESQKLAAEARALRNDVSCMMEWIVGLIGALVGLIAIILAIAGVYWFRTQSQLREEQREAVRKTCEEVGKDLKPRVEAVIKQIQDDVRVAIDEKTKDFKLPEIGRPVSSEELEKLKEVDERLGKLEQAGGRLTANDYVLRGIKLVEEKHYDLALNAFNDAIAEDSKNLRAWFGRGYCLDELYRYKEAIQAYDTALGIKPNSYTALCNKGVSLAKLGRHDQAIQVFDKALDINPEDVETLSNKGNSLAKLGHHEEAIRFCNAALKIDPNFAGAYYNRACTYSLMQKKVEMLADLKHAVELDNENMADAKTDEDFKAFWNDPDFLKIVGE